jgi:hypothetical protein
MEVPMNKMMRLTVLATLLVLVSRAGSAQDIFTQPRQGEGLLGPFPFDQTVLGVTLSSRASAFLSVTRVSEPIEVNARVVADLSDLQRKVGALIDTIPLPTDNCNHFGVDNLVARIWGKQITINGNVATLKLSGDVDNWTCVKNPIPCTRVEWHGIVPEIVAYDCNPPIKNRNINQPFDAMLPFRLAVVDAHTVAVQLGEPSINLGGTLGSVTNGLLRIAGVDINGQARQALESAINPNLLKQSLPKEILAFNPVVTRAELLSDSGALAGTVEMNVSIDSKTLADLGQILQGGSQSGK